MKWPTTPPFPGCLAFQTALGFPAFSNSTGPLASIAPSQLLQSIPGHWTLSPVPPPRSLAVLASISPSPFPAPPCPLGVLSLQQSPTTTPEGFELLGAKGSSQKPEGPASGTAAHAIWGFPHVEPEARTSTGNPPSPNALEIPTKADSVPPTVGKEVQLGQGRKHGCSGQSRALTCAINGT